jgi:hypothetical protein
VKRRGRVSLAAFALGLPLALSVPAARTASAQDDPSASPAEVPPPALPRIAFDKPRVALLTDEPDAPVARRLAAELEALGFDRIVAPPPATLSPSELGSIARSLGVVAAIRIVPSHTGAEVWIVDRVTGKTLLREVLLEPTEPSRRADVLAVRAVELLRASLIEVEAAHPSRGDVPPPPAVREIVERETRRPTAAPRPAPPGADVFRVSAAPGLAWSPGGVPANVHPTLAVHWTALSPRLGFGAIALLPTVAREVCGDEGCASFSTASMAADVELELASPRAVVRPALGLAFGAVWARMGGDAIVPRDGADVDVLAALALGHAGLAVRIADPLALRADGSIGVTLPRVAMEFGDRLVATWGRPLLLVTLGAELRWRDP